MPRFTAAELAKLVEGRLEGESSLVIDGLETVEKYAGWSEELGRVPSRSMFTELG